VVAQPLYPEDRSSPANAKETANSPWGAGCRRKTAGVPFFSDQPFWGRRVAAVGAGPAPIPRKELTPERLAAAITTAVSDPSIRHNAASIGKKIRAGNGVQRAGEIIERYLSAVVPDAA